MTKVKYNDRVWKTNNSAFYSNCEYLTLTENYIRSHVVRTYLIKIEQEFTLE